MCNNDFRRYNHCTNCEIPRVFILHDKRSKQDSLILFVCRCKSIHRMKTMVSNFIWYHRKAAGKSTFKNIFSTMKSCTVYNGLVFNYNGGEGFHHKALRLKTSLRGKE